LKRKAINLHVTPIDNMWKVYLEKHTKDTVRFTNKEEFIEENFTQRAGKPFKRIQYYEKYHYIEPTEF